MSKITQLQGHITQHRETQSLFYYDFKQSIIYKNIKPLFYTPETNIINQLYTIFFFNSITKNSNSSYYFLSIPLHHHGVSLEIISYAFYNLIPITTF